MNKIYLLIFLTLLACSSDTENNSIQNTSEENKISEEVNDSNDQEFETLVWDAGYEIFEIFTCLEDKGLGGLPEPQITDTEIRVRFDDGYDYEFFEKFNVLISECEESIDENNEYAQDDMDSDDQDDMDSDDQYSNIEPDYELDNTVYIWDEPENIEWIEYNFNTADTFCEDENGYCAGWQSNASQECKDNYKFGDGEEDVQKRSTYEGCVYQMVFKPYISLVIDRTSSPLTQEQKRNGERLKDIGWNKPTAQAVEFRVSSDIPVEIVDASKEGMLAAIEYLGSYGPLRVYLVGNDVDEAEELAQDFCDFNYHHEEKNRCLDDQGEGLREMAYIYPGGNGFQQSSWNLDSPVQSFVHNPYADENNEHNIHPNELAMDRKVNAHEYFHVYQGAHNVYRGGDDNAFGWSTTRWVEEGAAVYFEQVLSEEMGWESQRDLNERTIENLDAIKEFTRRFPGISMKDVDTSFQTERLLAYCGNLCIGKLQYEFGHITFEYLEIKTSKEKILFEFWQEYTELGWADAFEKVFEMSVSDFYIEFEEFLSLSLDEQLSILDISR